MRKLKRNGGEIRTAEQAEGALKLEGYAATFGTKYPIKGGFEMIAPGAFDETDLSDVVLLFDHAGRPFARTTNGSLTVAPDNRGLFVSATLDDSAESQKLYDDIKAGLITKMSFAFDFGDCGFDDATNTQTITQIARVFDVSAVIDPANPEAEIHARHAAEDTMRRLKVLRLRCRV